MEFRGEQAIYLQIADYICEQILRQQFKAEDKIPSVRDFALLMQVNPNTVVRAYDYLVQKEIIYTKRGLGYFVTGNGRERALELKKDLFFKTQLPLIFKNLALLNIDFDFFKKLYLKHLEGEKHEKE